MSTGRPCSICSSREKTRLVAELVAKGGADRAIADQVGVNRMAVSRHRQNHIVAPAKALADAAGKGRDAIEHRAKVMAAAEAGDPLAFLELANIVADLRKVHERLERTADAAEQDNQRLAVAALSGQQVRVAETRAKMGGVGGYAPAGVAGGAAGQPFAVNIIFGTGETVSVTTAPPVPMIEHDVEDYPD